MHSTRVTRNADSPGRVVRQAKLIDLDDVIIQTTDPNQDDDITQGFKVPSLIVNTTAGTAFICVDNLEGYAEWIDITAGATGGVGETGPIGPTGPSGGGSADHGTLTGLSDDDHTQYFLADGTRTAVGDNFDFTSSNTAGKPWFVLSNTNDNTIGPFFEVFKDSASPADNDTCGNYRFATNDSGGNKLVVAQMMGSVLDVTNNDEAGQIRFFISLDGVPKEFITLNGYNGVVGEGSIIVNEAGEDIDFRIESAVDANAFFLDGLTGKISTANTVFIDGATGVDGIEFPDRTIQTTAASDGATGPIGATGPSGSDGDIGETGSFGTIGETGASGSAGSVTWEIIFPALSKISGTCQPDRRGAADNEHWVLDFNQTTNETAIFSGMLPRTYASGGLTVTIVFAATSATSGDVDWDGAFERIGAAQQDIDSAGFASVQSTNSTTVNGTAGNTMEVDITFTDGAQMDSVAAGEMFRLKITRDAANDSANGDMEILHVRLRET